MSEMRKWIENHYSLEHCFLIPREQRAYVQPHKWNFSNDFITNFVGESVDRVAIKMRPSVKNFMSIGKPHPAATLKGWDEHQSDETEYPSFKSNAMGQGFSYDEKLKTTEGTQIKPGLCDKANTCRYLDGGVLKLGLKLYPGSLNPLTWNGRVRFKAHNTDNASSGCDVQIFMVRQMNDGELIFEDIGGGVFNIPPNGDTDTQGAVSNVADYSDITGFGFVFKIINTDIIGNVPSGFTARFGFPDQDPMVEVVSSLVWRDFSVWEVITDPNGALRNQYESSNFHCFTAMHATFTNTQAEIYKGGSINAAQLSGLSDEKLPHTFSGLNTWLGNRTYDTNPNKSLAKGLHWNYRWEKVQDTFFIREDAEEEAGMERPSLLVCMVAPPANEVQNGKKFSFTLSGAVVIEYITEVRDAPVFLAPADTINLLARYCAVRAELPCLMENPSHWETLKSNVSKIVKHPVTKALAKEAAMAGLKLLLV